MEHISLPSFDIASGDSNEEFIHGDPVDPLGESQYDGNYDTIGVHSSWKTSSEELEANNINTKDDYNTLLVENDIEVKPRIEDLQNSIKKEEQTWNRDFLESVLYDVKNVKIEKFEPDVCHNLISYSNYPENEERIICKQESTPTTTFESTNPELEEASFSTRESVVERNGSNDNHNSSKTETKKQKCNVYQDPSSSKTTISDKPKQSDTIDNLDDSSTDNGWEEPSDDFAENNDHTPPGTPIDKPIMVADDSKITGGSKDSKITEICSNDNDDEDISKRNSSEMLSKEKFRDIEKKLYQDDYLSKPTHSLISISSNVIIDNNNVIRNKSPSKVKKVKKSNKPFVNSKMLPLITCKSDKVDAIVKDINAHSQSLHQNIMESNSLNSLEQTENTVNKIRSLGSKVYPNTSHSILRQQLEKKTAATCELSKIGDRSSINVTVDNAVRNKSIHAVEMKDDENCYSEPNKSMESNQTLLLNYDVVVGSSGLQIKHVCKICNKGFNVNSQLNRHLLTHCELKNYCCEKCGKAFKTQRCLKSHEYSVHSTKTYNCSSCSKQFKYLSVLKNHINNLHNNKIRRTPKTCNLCQKTLSSATCLIRHMRAKHKINGEQYICNDCSAVFNEKSTLTTHIKSKHLPPEYKCSKCPSMFNTVGLLNNHLYKQHMIEKKSRFICELCGKVCRKKVQLENHILTHYDEKQFSCEECGKCFRTSSNLAQHSVVHKNERPYACYLCDKAFRIRHHLKQHMSVHGMVSTTASKRRKRSNCDSNSVSDSD